MALAVVCLPVLIVILQNAETMETKLLFVSVAMTCAPGRASSGGWRFLKIMVLLESFLGARVKGSRQSITIGGSRIGIMIPARFDSIRI